MLTLTGFGGVGKSRAGLELARLCAETNRELFPNGVGWVELAEIGSGDEMIQRIAYSLNFGFHPPPSAQEQLYRFLRERRMLLVLDNTEQIDDAGARVSELLQAAFHLKLLVTTRRPFALVAEQVRAVDPLPEAVGDHPGGVPYRDGTPADLEAPDRPLSGPGDQRSGSAASSARGR